MKLNATIVKDIPTLPSIPRLEESAIKRIISRSKVSSDVMTADEFRKGAANAKSDPHAESNLQIACIKWFDTAYPKYSHLLFAIPNGGKRGVITATFMKKEGVRKGVPDIFLAIPKLHYCGMFIEMKSADGTLRKEQKEFISKVQANYKCVVCRNFDEFEKVVNDYLK